jgi:2OG-Fe(II) oxygenase superfamily
MDDIPAFRFSKDQLAALASELASQFRHSEPFSHLVLRNFLPDDIANRLAQEFPGPNDINWRLAGPGDVTHSGDKNIEKISTSNEQLFPPLIRHVMHEFNSGTFLNFVSDLTGFEKLAPDPWFHGCGLHSTGKGGRLMIHADASRHPNPKLQQILNLIYYVTPNWQEEWGGHLELWDKKASACVKRVAPEFNSALIFFTGTKSYHGHPHPLAAPDGIRRNSLAVYYYTTERVVDEDYEGYKNYVQWVRTNDLDKQLSLYHRGKAAARRFLPAKLVNVLATMARHVKR